MNLLRIIGIWMLVALTACAVNPVQPYAEDESPATPVEILLYAESTRPDELGRIVVPVMLNEQGPFYFMLDTGATHTVLTRPTLQLLGLQADEQRQVALKGVSGVKRVPTVIVQSLQAGSLQFNQLRMPVLSGSVLEGLDGILGMDSLSDTRIIADLQNDRIRITDASLPAEKDHTVIGFNHGSRRLIMVDARVGRVRTRAIIDTGGAHTLGNAELLKALLRQSRGRLAGVRQSGVTDATDTTQPALLARVPRIAFGPVAVENLPVAFGQFSVFDTWGVNDRPALLIGMDVLGLLEGLTIDYRRKELHIAKVSDN